MSSDNYLVRIEARDGARVRLRAVLTGNSGFAGTPHPEGRSFFLMLAHEVDPGDADDPESTWSLLRADLVREARASSASSAASSEQVWDLLFDETWLRDNIDRYVVQAEITAVRVIDGGDEDVGRFGRWLWNEAYGEAAVGDGDAIYRRFAPSFECVVDFARPEYASALEPGMEFGTTAYPAWLEPPSRKLFTSPNVKVDGFLVDAAGKPKS